MTEIQKDFTPDWVKNGYSKASDWKKTLKMDEVSDALPTHSLKVPTNVENLQNSSDISYAKSDPTHNCNIEAAQLHFKNNDLMNLTQKFIKVKNLLYYFTE